MKMDSNTTWDVEKYRTEFETDEHWELRRDFMLAHKDRFSEDRLVCLAQVFTNIEFFGCRYPAETMELVAQLSDGVADSYREKQKTKLQRTFVKASDAAEAKAKGLKRPVETTFLSSVSPSKISRKTADGQKDLICPSLEGIGQKITSNKVTPLPVAYNNTSNLINFVTAASKVSENQQKEENCKENSFVKVDGSEENSFRENSAGKGDLMSTCNQPGGFNGAIVSSLAEPLKSIYTDLFGKFIIVESNSRDTAYNILNRSASISKMPLGVVTHVRGGEMLCSLYINQHLVVSVSDPVKTVAQDVAAAWALDKLRDICYTLRVKKCEPPDKRVVDREAIEKIRINKMRNHTRLSDALNIPLPEDNIGNKLMRTMGWCGGGLGKAGQGIKEPVSVSSRFDRAGLGVKEDLPALRLKVKLYLCQYIAKEVSLSLLLKLDQFSQLELNVINLVAKGMDLQCKTVKKDGCDPYLQIFKKEPLEIIVAHMIYRGVDSNDSFRLLRPLKDSVSGIFNAPILKASDLTHLVDQKIGSEIDDPINSESFNDDLKQLIVYLDGKPPRHKEVKEGRKRKRRKQPQQQPQQQQAQALHPLRRSSRLQGKSPGPRDNHDLKAIQAGPYGSFFLVENAHVRESARRIMMNSIEHNFVDFRFDFEQRLSSSLCKVFVNHHLLTTCAAPTKQKARDWAFKDAYEKLKQICYVLKMSNKHISDGSAISKVSEGIESASVDKPMEENIGSKLMKSMGWSGGALGKDEQGIKEPIGVTRRINRAGLGIAQVNKNQSNVDLTSRFKSILEKYVSDDTVYDLVFANDFSREERALCHSLVRKYKDLKSSSYGLGKERYLVVSKKGIYLKLVESILHSGEYSTPLYELVKPPISLPCDEPQHSMVNEPQIHGGLSVKKEEDRSLSEDIGQKTDLSSDYKPLKTLLPEDEETLEEQDMDEELYGNLIIFEDEKCSTPIQIIEKSANACRIPFQLKYNKSVMGMTCRLYVNNVLVSANVAINKKIARELCVSRGLEKLKEYCYHFKTRIVKDGGFFVQRTLIRPSRLTDSCNSSSEKKEFNCDSKELNTHLLRINPKASLTREEYKTKVRKFLDGYMSDKSLYDLVISPEFSTHEKMVIQQISSNLGLKVHSYDVGKVVYSVISKKYSPKGMRDAILLCCGHSAKQRNH